MTVAPVGPVQAGPPPARLLGIGMLLARQAAWWPELLPDGTCHGDQERDLPVMTSRRLAAVALVQLLLLGLLTTFGVTAVLAASITVNSLADSAADDGVCTLREAITAANADAASGATGGECGAGSGADQITFSASGTITLGSVLPTIDSAVTIDGAGAITVSGADTVRVFEIAPAGTVTLTGLTITDGFFVADGGGIRNAGTLTLTSSTLSGNSAGSEGGAIDNLGTLVVTTSTMSGNAGINAGAILNSGTLTVADSTISGNTATALGGGIGTVGTATVVNSTISENTASTGGGIFNNFGTLNLTNSTVSANSASLASGGIRAQATESIVNSIVAGNTAPVDTDIGSVVETDTTNVIGVPGGMTLADILVPAGLADNGGPTETIALALVAGNPAIDTATSATCAVATSGLDQRGLPRPSACDIGAYEAQPPTIASHASVSATATSTAGAVVSYTSPAGTDEQGGNAAVSCLPASGSTFPVGSTMVTCTATDAVSHTGTGTFVVTVSALAAATPTPAPSQTALPNTSAPGDGSTTSGVPALSVALAFLALLGFGVVRRRQFRA